MNKIKRFCPKILRVVTAVFMTVIMLSPTVYAVMDTAAVSAGDERIPVTPLSNYAPDGEDEVLVIPVPQVYIKGDGVTPNKDNVYQLPSGAISMDDGFQGSIELSGDYELTSPINMTGGITILSGNFTTNNEPISADSIFIGEYVNSTQVNVSLGTSAIRTFNFSVRGDNVNLDPGTSTITTTLLFDNAAKTGRTYYNVKIKSEGTVYGYLEGKSVFKDLEVDNLKGCYMNDPIAVATSVTTKGVVVNNPTSTTLTKTTVAVSIKPYNPIVIGKDLVGGKIITGGK